MDIVEELFSKDEEHNSHNSDVDEFETAKPILCNMRKECAVLCWIITMVVFKMFLQFIFLHVRAILG